MAAVSPRAPRQPRARRRRGAVESLGSIVLGFESIVVFLGGLALFGLRVLPESIPAWWAIVAGSVLAILMVATAGMLRYRWAIAVGWVLQVVVALGGILEPALVVVALIFGGMWGYATIKGAALDRRNAALTDPGPSNGD